MEYCFDTTRLRRIQEANRHYYDRPVHHPTRNMTVHDFIYLERGEWGIGVGKERYTLQPNEVLILPAHLSHYAVSKCAPGTATLYFHVYAVPEDSPDTDPGTGRNSLVLQNHLQTAGHPYIKSLFERIIQTQSNEHISSAYVYALLYELQAIHPQKTPSSLAQNMYDYIRSAEKLLTNQEIADHFRISKRSAEVAFKHEYGITIHSFVTESILDKARRYLENYPDMKMNSIAVALGFCDEFHFSKVFKAKNGICPSEYKRIHHSKALPIR